MALSPLHDSQSFIILSFLGFESPVMLWFLRHHFNWHRCFLFFCFLTVKEAGQRAKIKQQQQNKPTSHCSCKENEEQKAKKKRERVNFISSVPLCIGPFLAEVQCCSSSFSHFIFSLRSANFSLLVFSPDTVYCM